MKKRILAIIMASILLGSSFDTVNAAQMSALGSAYGIDATDNEDQNLVDPGSITVDAGDISQITGTDEETAIDNESEGSDDGNDTADSKDIDPVTDNDDPLTVDAIYPVISDGSGSDEEPVLAPEISMDQPERTELSCTEYNITINLTRSTKEIYAGTSYMAWTATISHKSDTLAGATIMLYPGTGQVMYGNAADDYSRYISNVDELTDGLTSWSCVIKDDYAYKSITISWMTRPTDVTYWDTHGFLSCSILAKIGSKSASMEARGVYKTVPSLTIKAVDNYGNPLVDSLFKITSNPSCFAKTANETIVYADRYNPLEASVFWSTDETGAKSFTDLLALGAEYYLSSAEYYGNPEFYWPNGGCSFTVRSINDDGTLDIDYDLSSGISLDTITNTLIIHMEPGIGVNGYDTWIAQVVGTGAGTDDTCLSGVVFDVYCMRGPVGLPGFDKKIGTVTSDSNGILSIDSFASDITSFSSTLYLVQTYAPSGYCMDKTNDDMPIYYSFIVAAGDQGVYINSRGEEWITAAGGSNGTDIHGNHAIPTIINMRKPGTLSLQRHDITINDHIKATDEIVYQIYEDAACTAEVADGEIILSKENGLGSSDAILNWASEYYIKETTDTSSMDTGYCIDEEIHGPYVFSDVMQSGRDDLSSCLYTADVSDMKITAVIAQQTRIPVRFCLEEDDNTPISGVAFLITDDAIRNDAGQTITTQGETTEPWDETDPDIAMLLTGGTYTAVQQDNIADGKLPVTFKFAVDSDGKVTIRTGTNIAKAAAVTATAPATITMNEVTPGMTISMEICTAEDGEYDDRIDKDKEIAAAPVGFAFSVYDDEECSVIAVNNSGRALTGLKTDSTGAVTISGLADGDYYLKSTQTGAVTNATRVLLDKDSGGNYSVFKITQEGGTVTDISKVNSAGRWDIKNGKIRAYLKKGSVTINAQSDRTFYLYRLYAGDGDSDDKREARKMNGDTVIYTNAERSRYFSNPVPTSLTVSNTTAYLGNMLMRSFGKLDGLLVLKARAAESANTINYAEQNWQLIGACEPGKDGSHTFDGLIAGQNYLIREGGEDDGDKKYYLAGTVSADKDLIITSNSEVIKPVRIRLLDGTEDITGQTLDLDAVDENHNKVSLIALAEGTKDGQYTVNGVPQQVKWTTSNSKIATVDDNGFVQALANGSAMITATTTDGTNIKATVKINIKTAVQQISITETTHKLAKGKKVSLTATVTPAVASNKNVTWRSDDDRVLTVTANGTVTAVATGTAHIYAIAADGSGVESTAYEISVTKAAEQVVIKCGSEDVTNTAIALDPDDDSRSYVNLNAECLAKDQSGDFGSANIGQEVTWKSANEKIATVSNGRVRALSAGTTQISATATDGSGKSAKVTINVARLIKEIEVYGDQEVASGKSLALAALITPDSAKNKTLTWNAVADYSSVADNSFDPASLPKNAITISASGKVSTNSKVPAGTVIRVKAAAKDGSGIESDWFDVKVTRPAETVAVIREGEDVTGGVIAVDPDETATIELTGLALAKQDGTLSDEDVSQSLIWKSANENAARVDQNGRVTVVGNGTSVITASTTDGSNKSGKVTVNVGRLITGITISGEEYVGVGKSTVLTAKITPDSAANKNLIWTVDDPTVASVANGRVTIKPRGSGSIRVTAQAKDGSGVEDSCILTILAPVKKVTIEKDGADVTRRTITQDITDDPSLSLTAVCEAGDPADEVSDSVTWKSSNTKVATVDEYGNVTLLTPGTATITASAADGSNKNASVTVKATRSDIKITSANEVAGKIEVASGKTVKLIAEGPAVDWQILSTVPAVENPARDLSVSAAGMLTVKNTVAAGTEITIKAVDKSNAENTAQCTVAVRNPAVTVNLLHNDNGNRIVTGGMIGVDRDEPEPVHLSAEVTDATGNTAGISQLVTWKSGNTKVVDVNDDGVVTPVAAGTAKVTATTADGMNKSATVTINVTNLTGRIMISSAGNVNDLAQGKSLQFTAGVLPARVSSKASNWYAEADYSGVTDPSFDQADLPRNAVSISSTGRLSVNAKVPVGTTIRVTAEAKDGSIGDDGEPLKSNVFDVNVTKPTGRIDLFDNADETEAGYSLTGRKLGMERDSLGDSLYLKAFAGGSMAFDADSSEGVSQTVIWSSSNIKVATVDQNGLVTSVGAGTAQIRATATDGTNKSASVTVNVSSLVTELEINGHITITGNKASTEKYTVNVKPDRAADKKVVWSAAYDLPDGSDAVLKQSDIRISNGTLSISRNVPVGTRITITATAADGGGATAEKVVTVE